MSVVTATYRSEFRVLVIEYRNGVATELQEFGDHFQHFSEAQQTLEAWVHKQGHRIVRFEQGLFASSVTQRVAQYLAVVASEPRCAHLKPNSPRVCNGPADRDHPCARDEKPY